MTQVVKGYGGLGSCEAWDPRDEQLKAAEAVEANGNLTLIRFEDGYEAWLSPHEVKP